MRTPRPLTHVLPAMLLFGACVILSACGSTTSGSNPDDDVILLMEDISGPVTEQDIREFRHVLDTGRERWHSYEPRAYVLTIGLPAHNEIRIEHGEDGNVLSETVVLDDWPIDRIPRSVDAVFDTLDAIVSDFEDGTTPVPAPGDCGHHVSATFDTDLGIPTQYDTLSPCDDGPSMRVSIEFPDS